MVATTFTLIAVFLPTAFMSGIAGVLQAVWLTGLLLQLVWRGAHAHDGGYS